MGFHRQPFGELRFQLIFQFRQRRRTVCNTLLEHIQLLIEFTLLPYQTITGRFARCKFRLQPLPLGIERVKVVAACACGHACQLKFALRILAPVVEPCTLVFLTFLRLQDAGQRLPSCLESLGFLVNLLIDFRSLSGQANPSRIGFFKLHATHTVIGFQITERLIELVDLKLKRFALAFELFYSRAAFYNVTLQIGKR